MPRVVMARNGAALLDGGEGARQRLRDALSIERGSYPFARDYGSTLGDHVDRNVDTAFESRIHAAVADAINHPPNGLDDVRLVEVRLYQGARHVEVQVLAEWTGETGVRAPIGARRRLATQS